jgi:hypothetical protein
MIKLKPLTYSNSVDSISILIIIIIILIYLICCVLVKATDSDYKLKHLNYNTRFYSLAHRD